MKKVSLVDWNPYLKDPEKRRRSLIRTVNTSSAVEGISYKIPTRKKKVKK